MKEAGKDPSQPDDGKGDDKSADPAAPSFKAPTTEEAQAFFMKVMTPFKANGKTIALRNAEEAVQLMQMGANYTKKLQQLQPHRKMLMMLENNDLLDPDKISFLIDVSKRDPEAIKKLIKDAGIDPLEIDTSSETSYSGGNHKVTDEEANFRMALDDLTSQPNGQETLIEIEKTWDQASKDVLWQSPELMAVMHSQRENGIYAQITDEINRQRTLGIIPATTPFLQAYKEVGDAMFATKESDKPADPVAKEPAAPTPVATRVATPKSPVANGDKASAASPTRSAPRKAEQLINPLAMSDEEFLKTMQDRL